MHPTFQQVFDEHAAPRHASKRAVHDQLAPIVRLAAQAQHQALEYRTLITDATLAAGHDPAWSAKLEHMHQTLGALEREATNLSRAARELAKVMEQLDRYMDGWKTECARMAP